MTLTETIPILSACITVGAIVYAAGRIGQTLQDLGKTVAEMKTAVFDGDGSVMGRLRKVESKVDSNTVLCEERHKDEIYEAKISASQLLHDAKVMASNVLDEARKTAAALAHHKQKLDEENAVRAEH